MSAERINQSPETERRSREIEGAAELHDKLREQREKVGEKTKENLDEAVNEARERARSAELERHPAEQERQPSPAERRVSGPTKADRQASFTATMTEVRSHMSAPSRAFSKVIHNPTVEKVSEVTGNTIARPNALLSGAIFAFALTLAVYLVAKNIGYPLSGFESIGAFILGWIIGIIYDFLKVMITGRR